MPVKKKTIIAFDAGKGQSLFFRAWRLMMLDGPLSPLASDNARLRAVQDELERYGAQMKRQQVHVDEIKRMCHVPID